MPIHLNPSLQRIGRYPRLINPTFQEKTGNSGNA
jgi:hypothetical protein